MIRIGLLSVCVGMMLLSSCSVRRFAVNQIGNALASGGSTYESDEDIELVGGALPFSLKLIESLLDTSPRHPGLLLVAASGFTQYGYVFVEDPADELAAQDLDRANAQRQRARRLYLRAQGYGMRGLEQRHPGFGAALEKDPASAVPKLQRRDVPLVYWTAAAHGLAISTSRNDPEMIAQIPEVQDLVNRALELDEPWGDGAIHEFLISFEGAGPPAPAAEAEARLRRHFDRALELSKGTRASVFVAYAEAASVRFQRRAEFQSLMAKALAIDAGTHPEIRLANLVAQRRARRLVSRIDDLFLSEPNQ